MDNLADKITIDTRTGAWLSEGAITGEMGAVVASSVLPGTTPEQVRAWYNGLED